MRFSSRFFPVGSSFCSSEIVISVMKENQTSFVDAAIIGKDTSQTGKVRWLVAFMWQGTPLVALVYPWLPMVALYSGGYGKRYCEPEDIPEPFRDAMCRNAYKALSKLRHTDCC